MTDDRDEPLARPSWHPEPELIFYGDEVTSRASMERLGADTWAVALDFLYDQAAHRAMGDPSPYATLRAAFFGGAAGPAPAPRAPSPIADVLADITVIGVEEIARAGGGIVSTMKATRAASEADPHPDDIAAPRGRGILV